LVHAIDIEPAMVALVTAKAAAHTNVRVYLRDFVTQGTGLDGQSAEYVMLFNILHAQEAPAMLAEAARVLRPSGRLGVIHWNYDATTPRGPQMDIRQRPEQCRELVEAAGFRLSPQGVLDLPPYHYGMLFTKSPKHQ
jgi:predicted methyltransferase